MLHRLDKTNEKIVAYRWEGEFNQEAWKRTLIDFLPELKTRSHLNIYLEVVDISGVEAKAIWEDIKFTVKNWNEIKDKIEKIALVSDKPWIRNLSETAYIFVPGIHLKSFTFEEVEAALAYANS